LFKLTTTTNKQQADFATKDTLLIL